VRHMSDTRTPEQEASAKFWNLPAGTHQPPGYWNEEATTLSVRYRLDERKTAHTLALLNMVAYDAIVASHEAKYFYWLIRPSQADAGIVLPIGLPNFPSYPSNHATISAGMARVLGARFPSESGRLDALAEEPHCRGCTVAFTTASTAKRGSRSAARSLRGRSSTT